jgi:hypothetical protein
MNLLHAPVGRPAAAETASGRAAPRTNHAAPTRLRSSDNERSCSCSPGGTTGQGRVLELASPGPLRVRSQKLTLAHFI